MTLFELLAIVVLIGLNALFVSAEYSLVRVRPARVESAAEAGEKGARLFQKQIESIDEYIAACQVGITLTSIGLGAVGEPTIARLLEEPLGNALAHGTAVLFAGIVSYLLISSSHITYGELVPKVYTVVHAERVGRRLARPMQFFRRVFHPFIVSLTGL